MAEDYLTHSIELGGYLGDASGFNAFNVNIPRNYINKETDLIGISNISYRVQSEKWRFRVGYMDLETSKVNGIAPDSNIFGTDDWGFQVVTDFYIKSKSSGVKFDFTRYYTINDKWTFEIGPTYYILEEKAQVVNETFMDLVRLTSKKHNSNFGALAGIEYRMSDRFAVNFSYRLIRPTDTQIHALGLNLIIGFDPN
jgi:opacity protein-like surface antigen